MSDQRSAISSLPADADQGPVEFDRATAFLLRHGLLIAVVAVLGAVGGWVAAHTLPRTYRSTVLMAPVAPEGSSPLQSLIGQYGALAGMAGIRLQSEDDSTAAMLAMLESRSFLERFIGDRQLLPTLFADHWDPERKQWRAEVSESPPTLEDGYGVFLDKVLTVTEEAKSGLVTVSVEWSDPQLAAQWANALVGDLNEVARRRAIDNANRSVEFLSKELESVTAVGVRQTMFSVLQSQINKRMLAITRPDFAFTVIDPAQPPGPNNYAWPIPLLFAGLGFFVGAFLGLLSALLSKRLPWQRA